MRFIERYFAVICIAVTLLGLFVPATGRPIAHPLFMKVFLAGILFFTGLKIDFAAALHELRRPPLQLYIAAVLLLGLPLAMWGLAELAVPRFALGVLILAAMPAGLAGSAFADIVKGNASLALVVTMVTSVLCPLTAPLVVGLSAGAMEGGAVAFIARQAAFLAAILFTPLAAAAAVRRLLPKLVARHRDAFTGLSVVSLSLLILAAMSANSDDAMTLLADQPREFVGLLAFLFGFSAFFHAAGYYIAPWRPAVDRAALSINAAYVNNGLAIVFATEFFAPRFGAEAVLPAILIEIPMILAIPVVGKLLGRSGRRQAGLATDEQG